MPKNTDQFQESSYRIQRKAVDAFVKEFHKELERYEISAPETVGDLYVAIQTMWIYDGLRHRRRLDRFARKFMPGSTVINRAKEDRSFSGN